MLVLEIQIVVFQPLAVLHLPTAAERPGFIVQIVVVLLDVTGENRVLIGGWVFARNHIFSARQGLDLGKLQFSGVMVAPRIDPALLYFQLAPCTGVGAVAQTGAVTMFPVRLQFNFDGRDIGLGKGGRVDLDLTEIGAAAEIALQFQQLPGIVGIAGFKPGIAIQQFRGQEVLLEGHVAEAVTRAGVIMQLNRRGISLQIDANGPFSELGFEIAAFRGQRFQTSLDLLILGLIQSFAFFQRQMIQQFLKNRVLPPFSQYSHVHQRNWQGPTSLHPVTRFPTARRGFQRGCNRRFVIAKRLQALADFLFSPGMEPAQVDVFRRGFTGEAVNIQER